MQSFISGCTDGDQKSLLVGEMDSVVVVIEQPSAPAWLCDVVNQLPDSFATLPVFPSSSRQSVYEPLPVLEVCFGVALSNHPLSARMRKACLYANPKHKNLVWFQRTRPNSKKGLSQKKQTFGQCTWDASELRHRHSYRIRH